MDEERSSLTISDRRRLNAARWWFELGNSLNARDELCKLPCEIKCHPQVLDLRWQVHADTENWKKCLEVANAQLVAEPDQVQGWLRRSLALHMLNRSTEGIELLIQAVKRFPGEWKVPFDLAVYYSAIGRMSESRAWFEQAVRIDPVTPYTQELEPVELVDVGTTRI